MRAVLTKQAGPWEDCSQLQPLPAVTQVSCALVPLSSSSIPWGLALESMMETDHSRLEEALT